MRVAVEKVGGSTLQQTVYDLICSGLTIGQVVSELPRLGYVGIDRRVIRELVEKARRRRGMRGQLARKRGLEQFDARKRSATRCTSRECTAITASPFRDSRRTAKAKRS